MIRHLLIIIAYGIIVYTIAYKTGKLRVKIQVLKYISEQRANATYGIYRSRLLEKPDYLTAIERLIK